MAHGSKDILDQALVLPGIDEARKHCSFLIGTSKQGRHLKRETLSSRDLGLFLTQKTLGHIGVVFGRESSGLTNQELELCDIVGPGQ